LPASSYRDVLRNLRFQQLWAAQFLAQVSQNAINFALIILINISTRSTLAGAVLVILFSLPAIVLGPLPGLLVDRVGRWWVMWTINVLRVLLGLWMALELAFVYGGGGHGGSSASLVVLLYLFSILLSVTTRFFLPAESTTIPRLVGLRGLPHSLALFGATYVIAQALGLIVLGPLLYLHFGPPAVFYFGAGGFAIALVLTVFLPPRRLGAYTGTQEELLDEAAATDSALLAALAVQQERQPLWQQMREGWQAIVHDRQALIAVLRLSLSGVVIAIISGVAPNFVVQVLHQPSDHISLVLGPAGVALLVGALLAPRLARRIGQLPVAALGVNGVVLSLVLLALNRPLGDFIHLPDGVIVALAVAESSLLGLALNLISIPCQTVMQERVLPRLRGQVIVLEQVIMNLASAPTLLVVGLVADAAGIPWALVVVVLLVALAAWLERQIKPVHPRQPVQVVQGQAQLGAGEEGQLKPRWFRAYAVVRKARSALWR